MSTQSNLSVCLFQTTGIFTSKSLSSNLPLTFMWSGTAGSDSKGEGEEVGSTLWKLDKRIYNVEPGFSWFNENSTINLVWAKTKMF